MATLSLAMIVKNEGTTIERVLGCAKHFCDEMIVVDTGSTDDTVAKAKALGAEVHHFTWIDDFAAARNFSFSKCTKDWIIWLDGDDLVTPENQERIHQLKDSILNEDLEALYLRYIYPPFVQWRERMVRRDLFGTRLEWREPIHECIHGIDGSKTRYFDNIFIQHDTPPERHELKKDRNIIILRRHHQNGANDERTIFIYAVECLHSLLKEEAEEVLEKFFATAKQAEYRYEIFCKMYNFYIHFGEHQKALDAISKAIAEIPERAEAYFKLGKFIADIRDQPAAAVPLLHTASRIIMPQHGTPEADAYSYGPLEALCHVYFRLEDYEKARNIARKALEKDSPGKDWLNQIITYDPHNPPSEPLPEQWQEWTEGNLGNGVARHVIIRVLQEARFSPAQIITGLRIFDAKRQYRHN